MDAARFDTLTRLIGSRTSRRVLVGLAASGLLGIAVPDAEAAKCSNKKPCPECYQCKKHKCKPLTETACTNGTCQSGVCITPPPPPARMREPRGLRRRPRHHHWVFSRPVLSTRVDHRWVVQLRRWLVYR
jgi:hypothetical protein